MFVLQQLLNLLSLSVTASVLGSACAVLTAVITAVITVTVRPVLSHVTAGVWSQSPEARAASSAADRTRGSRCPPGLLPCLELTAARSSRLALGAPLRPTRTGTGAPRGPLRASLRSSAELVSKARVGFSRVGGEQVVGAEWNRARFVRVPPRTLSSRRLSMRVRPGLRSAPLQNFRQDRLGPTRCVFASVVPRSGDVTRKGAGPRCCNPEPISRHIRQFRYEQTFPSRWMDPDTRTRGRACCVGPFPTMRTEKAVAC